MEAIFEFVGGTLGSKRFTSQEIDELYEICGDGFSPNWSKYRERGAIVPREELDDRPKFKGYLGPMWDGTRRINGEEVYVLRYETQEVYDMLSH